MFFPYRFSILGLERTKGEMSHITMVAKNTL